MIASFLAALLTAGSPSAPQLADAAVVAVASDEAQDTEAALYKAGRSSIDKGDWQSAEQAFRWDRLAPVLTVDGVETPTHVLERRIHHPADGPQWVI